MSGSPSLEKGVKCHVGGRRIEGKMRKDVGENKSQLVSLAGFRWKIQQTGVQRGVDMYYELVIHIVPLRPWRAV